MTIMKDISLSLQFFKPAEPDGESAYYACKAFT